MEGYYRDILNQFKYDQEIDSYEELINFFQENNVTNAEDDLEELIGTNSNNCSLRLENDIMLPTPMGVNFLSNYNALQALNAIIPDIFKLCLMIDPNTFNNPITSTRPCPKIRISFEDTSLGTGAINVSRYQKILPINLIKSFLYFGYKSNFTLVDNNVVDFLEKKIENFIKTSASTNSSYTDAESIFDEIYNQDTLIQQLIQLNNLMDKVKNEDTDFTNIGNYNLPYLFTYYTTVTISKSDEITSIKYSNYRDKNTSSLSYCDIVYLNYLKKLVKDDLVLDNFVLLLNNSIIGNSIESNTKDNLTKAIEFIKKNNIFDIINLALEVKTYILSVITYNLNKKVYNIEPYAKASYLLITRKYYCIYAKNSNYNYSELEIPDYCNNIELN